ncbi:ABC transporter permease subunit [Ponticoccus alexandrii]|uniref:ABC transporter permease subunit n=1 Tax=Ponticoccus alexandrii TaxID=1943633 RepID=A0ABX7F9T2_9RHOB|nr:ABC transporter permease subunit [Ponticoccus alexandrii]
MEPFILRRVGETLLTALCLTTLCPNLEEPAKTQGSFHIPEGAVASWLERGGYLQPTPVKHAEWLGVVPSVRHTDAEGTVTGGCIEPGMTAEESPAFCGVLQSYRSCSTVFRQGVREIIGTRLSLTGVLMFRVMMLMVPGALIISVLAGMKEGCPLDRSLSIVSITTTASPEYVSGVFFIAVFASSAVGLKWLKGTATSVMDGPTFENFSLPVLTIALYGMGYIARLTRVSMAEVVTARYIRTARLKGVSFRNIVLTHALRNALFAPFTVIIG